MDKTLFVGIHGWDTTVAEAHAGPTWLLWGTEGDEEPRGWQNEPALIALPDVEGVVFSAYVVQLALEFHSYRGKHVRNVIGWLDSRMPGGLA